MAARTKVRFDGGEQLDIREDSIICHQDRKKLN
jgi:hypothetical protein